jgi:hypothetical protein
VIHAAAITVNPDDVAAIAQEAMMFRRFKATPGATGYDLLTSREYEVIDEQTIRYLPDATRGLEAHVFEHGRNEPIPARKVRSHQEYEVRGVVAGAATSMEAPEAHFIVDSLDLLDDRVADLHASGRMKGIQIRSRTISPWSEWDDAAQVLGEIA